MHCFLKWPGKRKEAGKIIRQRGAVKMCLRLKEGNKRLTFCSSSFVIPAITSRMKKCGSTHDLSHKVEGLQHVLQDFKAPHSKEPLSAEETLILILTQRQP